MGRAAESDQNSMTVVAGWKLSSDGAVEPRLGLSILRFRVPQVSQLVLPAALSCNYPPLTHAAGIAGHVPCQNPAVQQLNGVFWPMRRDCNQNPESPGSPLRILGVKTNNCGGNSCCCCCSGGGEAEGGGGGSDQAHLGLCQGPAASQPQAAALPFLPSASFNLL